MIGRRTATRKKNRLAVPGRCPIRCVKLNQKIEKKEIQTRGLVVNRRSFDVLPLLLLDRPRLCSAFHRVATAHQKSFASPPPTKTWREPNRGRKIGGLYEVQLKLKEHCRTKGEAPLSNFAVMSEIRRIRMKFRFRRSTSKETLHSLCTVAS